MKIAFVANAKATDVHSWSGTIYHMAKHFEKLADKFYYVDDLQDYRGYLLKSKTFYQRLKGNKFHRIRDLSYARMLAQNATKKLKNLDYDIILSPAPLDISMLEVNKPIFFWHDAAFSSMIYYHPSHFEIENQNILDGIHIDKLALEKSALAFYSTNWAAQSSIVYNRINPDKVKVVPYGANLEEYSSLEMIKDKIENLRQDTFQFLFMGVDWWQKGGDLAVNIVKRLNESGVKSELHVVGCTPPDEVRSIPNVKTYGFISKSSDEGRKKLETIFKNTHFMLLPTRTEAFGISFAEANAYGVPAIGTRTGGVPEVIHEGKNGYLYEMLKEDELIHQIKLLYGNKAAYKELALSSYNEFLTRLNWETSCKKVLDIIQNHLK